MAVKWGIQHFHKYLMNKLFKVITDHSALKDMMKANKILKGRRARWVMELQQYDFKIEHRAGKENKNADTLSRLPYEKEINTLEKDISEENLEIKDVENIL